MEPANGYGFLRELFALPGGEDGGGWAEDKRRGRG